MTHELRQPNGERWTYEALCLARPQDLEEVMRRGTTPDFGKLSGWEFRGFNTPDALALVGLKKFKKGFYRADPSRPHAQGIQGYNVVEVQNRLGEPWIDVEQQGKAKRIGWYEARKVDLADDHNKYPNAILINYGASDKNFKADPSRLLRDYLVQVYPDNPDLYLGKAFIPIGPLRLPMAYFVLERHNPSDLGA